MLMRNAQIREIHIRPCFCQIESNLVSNLFALDLIALLLQPTVFYIAVRYYRLVSVLSAPIAFPVHHRLSLTSL